MLVNPELLRGFATQVDNASATLNGLTVGVTACAAADGLPGSSTQWAVRQVGDHLGLAAGQIATNVSAVGTAVRGAAGEYEVEDDVLAGSFTRTFVE